MADTILTGGDIWLQLWPKKHLVRAEWQRDECDDYLCCIVSLTCFTYSLTGGGFSIRCVTVLLSIRGLTLSSSFSTLAMLKSPHHLSPAWNPSDISEYVRLPPIGDHDNKTQMQVIAALQSVEVCKCQRRFWTLPIIGAGYHWHHSTPY